MTACQKLDPMGNVKRIESLTSEVFSDNRIGGKSTNEQQDEDGENEAPLQPGQLLPFLQAHRRVQRRE